MEVFQVMGDPQSSPWKPPSAFFARGGFGLQIPAAQIWGHRGWHLRSSVAWAVVVRTRPKDVRGTRMGPH